MPEPPDRPSLFHQVLIAIVTALLSFWGAQYLAKQVTADAMAKGLAVIEERQNNQYRELKDSIRELREDLRENGRLRRE